MIPPMRPRFATSRITTCSVLAAVVVASPVQAQDERAHTRVVVGGGVSFAGGDSVTIGGHGFAGHVGLQHQRENLVFSIRVGTNYGGVARTLRGGGLLAGRLRDRFDEIALMAGYAVYKSDNSQVVLSAGLASVSGERVGTGPAPSFGTTNVPFAARVGVPLQLAISAPGGGSDFGLTVHANLNPEEAFGAFTVTYLIGRSERR